MTDQDSTALNGQAAKDDISPERLKKRLRLVKAVVQPYFVIDDGETLTEMIGEPISVPAAKISEFPMWFEAYRLTNELAINDPDSAADSSDAS